MKNLHEIVDSLIEVSTSKDLSDKVKEQIDVIIDELVYIIMEKDKRANYDYRKDLSDEELEDIMLFETLVKGMIDNKIAIA